MHLSILIPCLNEEETLAVCIQSAREGARAAGILDYEILVADNGSTDNSARIAKENMAAVVPAEERGYGSALLAGLSAARGEFVVMGDADGSYDFRGIPALVDRLNEGADLVLGSRFRGRIEKGAMPVLNRYLGNPILTGLANLFFGTRLSDYHSGLRAFRRDAIVSLDLRTQGMEFASEMIVRAATRGLKIAETPITYRPDGRSRPPHLRPWGDGWRHLRFLLLYSPRWLFLYPGLLLGAIGLVATAILMAGPARVGGITLDVHTLIVMAMAVVLAVQLLQFSIFSRVFAARAGLLPSSERLEKWIDSFSLGWGIGLGILLASLGAALLIYAFIIWEGLAFGPIQSLQNTLRVVVGGSTCMILGMQLFFGSFLLSQLGIRSRALGTGL